MRHRYNHQIDSYVYIVGSTSDQIVRFNYQTNITADDIFMWHMEKFQLDSLGIFIFKDLDSAIESLEQQFKSQKISDGIYRISFDEARFCLLLEQRRQNNIDLPMCISFSLVFGRIITYMRYKIFKNKTRRKYLHDNHWIGKTLYNVQICSEGFTN